MTTSDGSYVGELECWHSFAVGLIGQVELRDKEIRQLREQLRQAQDRALEAEARLYSKQVG